MNKKKPVVKITEKLAKYTVLWVSKSGISSEFTTTDEEKFQAVYFKCYLEYINGEIRELQIRTDV